MNTTNATPPLLLWQKRQAAMIYYFTSLDYLKEVQRSFNDLLGETDQVVDKATQQERDRLLTSKRWGNRDTVDNWANSGAWAAMKDEQKWLAKLVALRSTETYADSGAYGLARMLQEFSTFWMTPGEEADFEQKFKAWYHSTSEMDLYIKDRRVGYKDYDYSWKEYSHLFPRLPKLRIRTDVEGESGKVPPRTGVYVAQNDPNAGLQFGWTGNYEGYYDPLPDAHTFNDLGLQALAYIGRENFWVNETKINEFCMLPQHRGILTYGDPPKPSGIGDECVVERPCKWYFVEMIHGEYDDEENAAVIETPKTLRALPGENVPADGKWYTPAIKGTGNTLQLNRGDKLPATQYTEYGAVIWYCDPE
jgi:hypothetical protein